MKNMISYLKPSRVMALALVAMASMAIVSTAGATAPYDFSGVGTSVSDQVSNAFDFALPIGGAIIALFVGWRVLKRLVHG